MRLSFVLNCVAIFIGMAVAPLPVFAKTKLPNWVESAMENIDAYDRFEEDNQALILHSSRHRIYRGRGNIESNNRHAIHLKTRDHRNRANATIPLANKTQKIASFNAWIIYPSGKIETFRKKDLVTLADEQDSLFSEAVLMILNRSQSARDDTVFAYEYTVIEKSIFLQTSWHFQDAIPTIFSQISVTVPRGWNVRGDLINSQAVERTVEDHTFIWTARNVPEVKEEPLRPPASLLYSFVGLTIEPSDKDLYSEKIRVFENWSDVARYGEEVQRSQLSSNSSMQQTAEQLVAGLRSNWEKIKAVCEYAQSLNYVAISMDLNSGGGYTPHKATEVFEKHYGDCKDMTILARSLLKCLDIDSLPTLASIGQDAFVHEAWPSPLQFNHCILAVPIDEAIDSPAIIDHPTHGKTLIFDPTQRFVPVGHLPQGLQGTKILIGSEQSRSLHPLPLTDEQGNSTIRSVDVEIIDNGDMKGTITEECHGNIAEYLRYLHRSKTPEEFEESITSWISRGTNQAAVEKIEIVDEFEKNSLTMKVEFRAKRYARRIGNDSMSIVPVFLGRHEWVPPNDEVRSTDYISNAWSLQEEIRISFPDNYFVETRPTAVETKSRIGEYSISSHAENDCHSVSRSLLVRNDKIPPDDYPKIVEFYERISRADSRPLILKWNPNHTAQLSN